MLLGSDDTLNQIGDIGSYVAGSPGPVLVISPNDLFGTDVTPTQTQGNFSRVKKEIGKRLTGVINRYAGQYGEDFNRAIQDPKFKAESAENIRDGLPFAYPVDLQNDGFFDSGIVFIPGDPFDPKVYVAKATKINPSEITGEIGTPEFWKTALISHEFWHLARPEIGMVIMDESLIPNFYAAVRAAPTEFDFYQEIMSDFIAIQMAAQEQEQDDKGKFMQSYIDTRVVSAIHPVSDIHRTGLALNCISENMKLPKLSILAESADNLFDHLRYPLMREFFNKKGIANPNQFQLRAAYKEFSNLSLGDMIMMAAYSQHAGRFSNIDSYNVATTILALDRLHPVAVAAKLGHMRDQIIESAEKVSMPPIEPEAPHYQAALTYFSEDTKIEEGPDGSKILVRPDGTRSVHSGNDTLKGGPV